ncbi:hypothetical protein PR202_gb10800 [Eleusine coracana subsp. coracana]|uniref:Uncharacterized protein n=1 Tax=Eleusine coracana subsp. coracana TaxID=191504 RepID=A0AAV5EL81_ELECO|nr:hypothetical protein PR202_gb10800 [Eleusine coracana subsp. coracana]
MGRCAMDTPPGRADDTGDGDETQEPSGSGEYASLLDAAFETGLAKSMARPPPRSGLCSRELLTLVASDDEFDMLPPCAASTDTMSCSAEKAENASLAARSCCSCPLFCCCSSVVVVLATTWVVFHSMALPACTSAAAASTSTSTAASLLRRRTSSDGSSVLFSMILSTSYRVMSKLVTAFSPRNLIAATSYASAASS